MGKAVRLPGAVNRWLAVSLEAAGLTLVTIGLHHIYEPAAFIFAGVGLVFFAQGVGRDG